MDEPNEPRASDGGDEGGRKPFLLRLPPDLHAELKRWAAAELRSLNGQIEFLLRDALRRRGARAPQGLAEDACTDPPRRGEDSR